MTTKQQTSLRFAGAVFAGGKSTRMGTNKAAILVKGVPLWRRQFDLLGQAGAAHRVISLGKTSTWRPEGVPLVADAELDAGPISGLAAVLSWIESPEPDGATHVMVAAVDLPNITAAWFLQLAHLCSIGKGAVGRSTVDGGYYEPLAAIYPREMLEDVRAALLAGHFSLQRLVEDAVRAGRMAIQVIAADQTWQFVNWNRPEDVDRG